jgi:DNA polymerase-3 subunit alpha
MDFLGLRTLTIIQDTVDNIKIQSGEVVDPDEIPLDSPEPFELLTRGETVCVFQLESGGMQDLCRRWHVETIEHIIALIALYRPGPMQFIDEFIDRKFGRKKIDYDVPEMKPILEETYGIMLYQEQVMQVVQTVAGFSLDQADILRRAMGKKKADVMAEQYGKFEEGCQAFKGIGKDVAKAIWDKI